jgi:hypothetical protein
MKAEHRKELQTNYLADQMGRLVQGMRAGPRSSSPIIWVIGLLTVGTLIAWYWASSGAGNQSAGWVKLEAYPSLTAAQSDPQTRSVLVDRLARFVREHPGTIAARTARFQQARLLLGWGLEAIYTDNRPQAVEDLENARQLFHDLAAECKGNAILEPEAILSEAKAEEALVGIPKREPNADERRGSLDRALKLYQQAARDYPDSFQGKMAQKHARDLEENRTTVAQFYEEIGKFGRSRQPTEPSPAQGPGLPEPKKP